MAQSRGLSPRLAPPDPAQDGTSAGRQQMTPLVKHLFRRAHVVRQRCGARSMRFAAPTRKLLNHDTPLEAYPGYQV